MKAKARSVPVSESTEVVPPSATTQKKLVELGDNPVDTFYARRYACESSPSTMAVILELTENARDNATEVKLTLDVEKFSKERGGQTILVPRRIICEDNGVGLTHSEFLNRFCGAYSDSEAHHDIDRAGRNGVGTKTYTSIAKRALVTTTTARPTEGLDENRELIEPAVPAGVILPRDGEPDEIRRTYEFRLHSRAAIPSEWTHADRFEMGTRVELIELLPDTRISWELLRERLSYAREWLSNAAHTFTIQLIGNVPEDVPRKLQLKPWQIPDKSWLVEAQGSSDAFLKIWDRVKEKDKTVEPITDVDIGGKLEFDLRAGVRDANNELHSLEKPAIVFEVCGAVPYAPQLDGNQSSRTLPLLSFLGLENVSSIGSFQNSICGWIRINSLALKQSLRNNKTTLAGGPDAFEVLRVRDYLRSVIDAMHDIWYDATRQSQDDVTAEPLRDATSEVNLAIGGANRNPFKGGNIVKKPTSGNGGETSHEPIRRHRWECGACQNHWLADADFKPTRCAETSTDSGAGRGCGSTNIGLAKNQPRIAECQILLQSLGDEKRVAEFQMERLGPELQVPVVRVNTLCPRYVELRGTGDMSKQAVTRLKQYFIDGSLVAVAEYYARLNATSVADELGILYFNRMTRSQGGIKKYRSDLAKLHATTIPTAGATSPTTANATLAR